MRELRDRLSGVADEVLAGGDVFAGSHRKPELVLMSVRRYQELTAASERGDKPVSPSMGETPPGVAVLTFGRHQRVCECRGRSRCVCPRRCGSGRGSCCVEPPSDQRRARGVACRGGVGCRAAHHRPHIGRRGQWPWCAGAGPPAGVRGSAPAVPMSDGSTLEVLPYARSPDDQPRKCWCDVDHTTGWVTAL